jgi:D-alanyl-lipoteichoic acid acyltransferase DltB (MBOAT superfamily)
MTCALLILAGVWFGATVGYIFAGIMLMGRD